MAEQPEWMNTKDAAEYLGLALRSLYRFIDEGELAAYKFGRVIRMQRSDLDEFISRHKVKPGDLGHLYVPLQSERSKAG